jgi:hypothetical protein
LQKPLCAGILRKWFLKITHIAVEDVSPKTVFENLFFKQKLCRNLNKGIA